MDADLRESVFTRLRYTKVLLLHRYRPDVLLTWGGHSLLWGAGPLPVHLEVGHQVALGLGHRGQLTLRLMPANHRLSLYSMQMVILKSTEPAQCLDSKNVRDLVSRIRMFLGLLDSEPDPLVRGMYRIWIQTLPSSKTLTPTVLWLLYDFFSLKNYATVSTKSNKQKK